MKKYLLLLATCLAVTGCSLNSKKEAIEEKEELLSSNEIDFEGDTKEEEIETVEQIPGLNEISVDVMNVESEEVRMEPVEVTIKTLQREYQDSNDNVVSFVKIDYPVIQDELKSEGILKINEYFKDTAEALYEENNTYAIDNVESLTQNLEEQPTNPLYSEYRVTVEVKYNANGIISILQKFSEKYTGKIETNSYATGYVFDINTGERFTIEKVLAGTNQEVANKIGQAFMDSEHVEERVKTYYKEEIQANTQYVEFYLDMKNINFFYNPNMVVPYGEGTLEATLPLSTPNLLKLKLDELVE